MVRPEAVRIVKHVPMEELNNILRVAERDAVSALRIKERLTFIRMRYMGYTVPEAAKAAGISYQTGYNIQELWNEGGPAALEPKFGGGRPSKLTEDQKQELFRLLRVNPMETSDVRLFIMEEYGAEYSMKQVYVILKKEKLHHAKPYPKDHRRPDDAEGILKKDS